MSPQVVLASMPSSEPTAKGQTDENQAGVGAGAGGGGSCHVEAAVGKG